MLRSESPRSPGEEDEAKEEEGLLTGRSGEAGAEGHEWRRTGEEEHGGMKKDKNEEKNQFYEDNKMDLIFFF